jgi:hypothetical protein
MQYQQSHTEKYIFQNKNDGMVVGGFPIQEIINSENSMYGGNGIGEARFENLVIPAGLFISNGQGTYKTKTNKEQDVGVLDHDNFNKLFDLVRFTTPYSRAMKTKKNETPKQNKTKRKQ